MAQITIDGVAHSYLKHPNVDSDFVLKHVECVWQDGGAYAVLGPSGCGKTTLLNAVSGLIVPSKGRILGSSNESVSNSSFGVQFACFATDY